jgi:hypothetical protein
METIDAMGTGDFITMMLAVSYILEGVLNWTETTI